MQRTTVIGVDCATTAKKLGLALAEWGPDGLELRSAEVAPKGRTAAHHIAGWMEQADRTLIALDAPLGWPDPLRNALPGHRAGEPLACPARAAFARATDLHLRSALRKSSLNIGADRIAWTTHWTLRLLDELRSITGHRLPLAWSPAFTSPVAAIEVYPAATLKSCGLPFMRYKKPCHPDHIACRREIVAGLAGVMAVSAVHAELEAHADVLDAAVCALAAADFLSGRADTPAAGEETTALREGWIWFRPPAR